MKQEAEFDICKWLYEAEERIQERYRLRASLDPFALRNAEIKERVAAHDRLYGTITNIDAYLLRYY